MTTLILLVIAFGAGVATATAWFRQRIQLIESSSSELEKDIIRNAIQHGGRITALDVRSRSAESLQAVETRLRAMHTAGYCESDLDEDGRPIYIFPAFDEAPLRALRLEKQVLQLARRSGGVVRASALTVETDLSYAEAKELLEHMTETGMCEATEDADSYRFFPVRSHVPTSVHE